MPNTSNKQELVDICFSLVSTALDHADYWKDKPIEDRMSWVAKQLKECGFDTFKCGASWGTLR